MRVSRVSVVIVVTSLMLFAGRHAVAVGNAAPEKAKAATPPATKMKPDPDARPAAPAGTPRVAEADLSPTYKSDTIKTYRNAHGQTVYSIAPSHFDVSRPLREMALPPSLFAEDNEEWEAPENPQLPSFRHIRSNIPDPVVQEGIPTVAASAAGGPAPLAPTTGFNFAGVGTSGSTPSDSNGSVGNNQFVETVNTRYQVWSLNHTTKVATSALGPIAINSLWSGFGGACQSQNSGDPIVLFDKASSRWLISQFTTTAVSGVYYQCVAISQTGDATGVFYRYAFAVPNGIFGDYPHFGSWTDAYYMMAHGFQNTSGGYVAALFAAMDRQKMLVGNPTSTWQVIQDPSEGGHMPADLDGFALPPTNAPGVFLSLHSDGMYIYRMKVDFTTPANTTRTLQAIVPVAPSTGACGGGACIPQPGTTQLVSSLGDRLMFRAAYRNFVDHETILISHSVDPSVSGVASGVRWYDIRLSGAPDATCPTYPCLYQQGTFADGAGGRSRWMGSIAMDTAENVLLGYNATGKTNGSDNHSIRYTGRAKNDPPGTMTAPETVIATGTANNLNSRWGDYTSMSVDPFDDCTLWYVAQYFTATSSWSTRIASAGWPAGSGAGQCPATSCLLRPSNAPTIGAATVPGDNQITVNWTAPPTAPGSYAIERADGACGSEGMYRPLGFVSGSTTTYTDTTVLGGLTYSYRVIAAADGAGKCQAKVVSGCTQATATGTCNLKPVFAGAASASSAGQSNCGVTVTWGAAATACPLTPNLRYNIFRGTTPDFVPSLANRIAACVPGPTSYVDTDHLQSGVTYYYVVRAEDDSTGNGGECAGGNEEANSIAVPGTAYGSGAQSVPGTWLDDGGDTTSFLALNVAGPGDTGDKIWRYVKTVDDAGANHTPGGSFAYRNAGPGAANTYGPNTCAETQSPALTAAGSTVALQYWERHQIEYHWDGLAVEYSVNGGAWNDVPPPSNDTGAGCSAGDDVSGWETLSCTDAPPINGCGYPATKPVLNGPLAGGTSCNDWATGGTTAYTHRCHPISGLAAGDEVRFRWRFASDPGAEFSGVYLDDLAVTNVRLPNACVPDTCAGQANGTPCNDGSACTTGDSCGGGVCQPGVSAPAPGEVGALTAAGAAPTTVSWDAVAGATTYDVASATLSELRANGTATAACIANDVVGTSAPDPRGDPAEGDGYYYLVRAQTPCASGTYGLDSANVERVPASACP